MKTKIILLASFFAFVFASCNDVLDRPPLTEANDETYWTSEEKLRLYANEYYTRYFAGYGIKNVSAYTALLGYAFSDDMVVNGNQTEFERSIPAAKGNTSTTYTDDSWQSLYTGPTWNFAWVRKSNIMVSRIETRMGSILNDEQKNHWLGIARFFRGMEYAGLVTVFGDVPYYDHEVASNDFATLYKERTPRNEVMDAVYNDLKFALDNVRNSDGDQYVNRYVVAAYISRLALVEGTWQKYHYNNSERAKKFLDLTVEAADYVRNSNKFDIVTDFRSLFGSTDLKGNKDCIFYRNYNASVGITHPVASNCNLSESRNMGPSLSLIKAFICNDGQVWQNSATANATKFDLANMVKTRDPRFEASFWDHPSTYAKGSFLAICKFIDREGPTYAASGQSVPNQYSGTNNVNNYPVMRYAEVLLNWIEAKAELESLGGTAVLQSDIDVSINKIRNRPLDKVAIDKGVTKTASMNLSALPYDPAKDPSVSDLLWEIRRERRMELAFEHSRIIDLRRWKKLSYMDDTQYPDILKGTWVNFPTELPSELVSKNIGVLAVSDVSGTITVYNGTNANKMVGFYSPTLNKGRQPFLNQVNMNPYLSPVGNNERIHYRSKGYNLTQTEGWSQDMP